MTSRHFRQWLIWPIIYFSLAVLSSAQTTVSPSESTGPDSSVVAVIVLASILVGFGSLFFIAGVCFCCYQKCKDGCYV